MNPALWVCTHGFPANSEIKTQPAAAKEPNGAGLYDIYGNVTEWCQDWYNYYNCNAQDNPDGPELGALRAARGGSYAGTWNRLPFCLSGGLSAYAKITHSRFQDRQAALKRKKKMKQ